MSDLKMNMSLDDIIKTNKDDTNVTKSKGYINKKPRFERNNYANNYNKNPDDFKEGRNFKTHMNNRQNYQIRDYNNRGYRNVFNHTAHYKNRIENVQRNKVFIFLIINDT